LTHTTHTCHRRCVGAYSALMPAALMIPEFRIKEI
jgi:hypothetical protein